MINNYVAYLVVFKILISSLILCFFSIFLGWDMFKYPDFYSTYNKCSEYSSNILYGELFCSINSITGKDFTHKSIVFMLIAGILNMLLLVGYFKIFQKYLSQYGKYLFIILLVLHPYMGVYFFRFYTDLFASIGIFLITYYVMNNKRMDTFFIISSLILINFRVALIPVFFIYSLIEIYKQFNKNESIFIPIILFIFLIISLMQVIGFSIGFAQINSDVFILEKISYNFIFTFGFREAFVGVFREAFWSGDPLIISPDNPAIFIAEFKTLDYLSIYVSILLLFVHIIGLFGIIKFSIKNNIYNLLILFTYICVPLVSIGHMRYLLPLMPILLFGFSYMFIKKNKINIR